MKAFFPLIVDDVSYIIEAQIEDNVGYKEFVGDVVYVNNTLNITDKQLKIGSKIRKNSSELKAFSKSLQDAKDYILKYHHKVTV